MIGATKTLPPPPAIERSASASLDGSVPGFAVRAAPATDGARAVLAEYVVLAVREGSARVGLAELAHAFLSVLPNTYRSDVEDTAPIVLSSADAGATLVVRTLSVQLSALQDGRRVLEVRDHSTDERSVLVAHPGG